MNRIILHIDFDSFFASVEQQDNPLYRHRPLGVTATNGRTCIIAASREAKRLGIKSPSRTHDAKRICPSIIFIPAHFVRYFEISKIFLRICDDFSPVVEMFSLDEVFMDVTLTAKLFGGVDGLIARLKERLRTEIGEYVTASVGISHNKLLAKLGSGLAKPARHASPWQGVAGGPNGVVRITPDNVWDVYRSAELTDICGIGFRLEKRLNNMGITSLLQLRAAPLSALIAEFGNVEGHVLKNIGLAVDESRVIPYREFAGVKSVGRNYCLPQNEYDKRVILQTIYELCEEVALKLRRLEKKARTVGIYVTGDEVMHGRKTFSQYMHTGRQIFEACLFSTYHFPSTNDFQFLNSSINQFKMNVKWNTENGQYPTYVRQVGIWVSNLESVHNLPSPLLLRDQKEEKLTRVIDKLNERFGDHTVRNGFLLYADKLTTVPNGFAADRYERRQLSILSDA